MPIETKNLSGGYDGKSAVRAIALSLQEGEWLTLVGPNGSGKSTLLKLMSRLLLPQGGQVLLDGKAIQELPSAAVARKIALLPQQQPVPREMTVYQLVSLGRSPYQNWWQWEMSPQDSYFVQLALQQTQLQEYGDRPLASLSGGERQRAFLALALAQNPKILLLDEPTTYLDLNYQLQLLELLKYLNRSRQLTLITVLHDLNLAIRYSDRLAMLQSGKLEAVGTPEAVITPERVEGVFGVKVVKISTPVGLQIYPIASNSK